MLLSPFSVVFPALSWPAVSVSKRSKGPARILRRAMSCILIAFLAGFAGTPSARALQNTQPAPPPEAGAGAQTAPATAPAGGVEHLKATITGVEPLAQVRVSEDQPWQACKVGMVLNEGAEFRTGPRGAIRFTIPPDHTFTIDRLTNTKLLQAVMRGNKATTDVGMQYGRVRGDIEAAGIEHQSTVHSPNSTLAIRGTKVSLYDQRPFPPEAVSLTGRAQFSTRRGTVAFGGKGAGKTTVTAERGAAQHAFANTVIDPANALARSAQEQALVADVLSLGGTFVSGNKNQIPTVRGGAVPTDQQLNEFAVGNLNFILRWSGDAHLGLLVNDASNKQGEFLFPQTGLNHVPSGGYIPFDNLGGPNGGYEVAYWPKSFPSSIYTLNVLFISGSEATFKLNEIVNGQLANLAQMGQPESTTATGMVGPAPAQGKAVVMGAAGPGIVLPPSGSGPLPVNPAQARSREDGPAPRLRAR
jgi:hypothetical protein